MTKTRVTIARKCLERNSAEAGGYVSRLYKYLEPSQLMYEFLNCDNLKLLTADKFRVTLNAVHKTRYFVMFDIIEGIEQVALLPVQQHCSSDQIWCAHICANQSLFKGTILDGDLIQNCDGDLELIVSDIYKFAGDNWLDTSHDEKFSKVQFEDWITYNPRISSFKISWNHFYTCDQIMKALDDHWQFDFNGLVFIPLVSDKRYIFTTSEKANAQYKPRPKLDQIQLFTITSTDLPDVYPLTLGTVDHGFLYIPNLKYSTHLRLATRNNRSLELRCKYNGVKWQPDEMP